MNWEALPPPQAHIGRMTLSMSIKLFGKWNIKPFDFHVVVDQVSSYMPYKFQLIFSFFIKIGPAVVYLRFKLLFGNGAFLQTIVPEEPVMQRLTHYIYCDWWIPTFLATWILLSGDAIQVHYYCTAGFYKGVSPLPNTHTSQVNIKCLYSPF